VLVGRPSGAVPKWRSARTQLRLGLLALGLGKGVVATGAIIAPGSYWMGMSLVGGRGSVVVEPYNPHLVTDLGAALLAVAGFLLLAAVGLERRLVQAALVALLLQGLPHLGYHVSAVLADGFPNEIGSLLATTLSLELAIFLLVLSRRLPKE
jgi:hypothetical protein